MLAYIARYGVVALAAAMAAVPAYAPASAQDGARPIADGPSMNSFDMLVGRNGVPRQNLTARVEAYDIERRTLTADGTMFIFANNLSPGLTLRVGQTVMIQYEPEDGRNILHGITPIGN